MTDRATIERPPRAAAHDDDQRATDATVEGAVRSGAQAAVDALDAAGVEHCFGVQGGAIMPVYDALADAAVSHVTMAHEQAAAHAADAYGQLAATPGVCLATSGPGATNLVTGIADADMDSDALVALTGQVPTTLVGSDAFQETDTVGVTAPITKANFVAGDADATGGHVAEALALAAEGRPGPTLVDLPKDATTGETRADPTPPPDDPPRPTADDGVVAAAARALEASERPLLLLGGGVRKSEASDTCRALARDHEIPVVTTMPAVGTYPEDDPLALGMAGMHGTGAANLALAHADCLLAVGCRFDNRLTGDVETFAPEATVLHVDVDPAEHSKNVHADHPLCGDARAVVDQLRDALDATPEAADWRDTVGGWRDAYPLTYDVNADGPLRPELVVEAVDAATADDAVVTTGVGQHQMWAVQYWTFTRPDCWLSSHGLGAMGYGLPAAIGAKLAVGDDREVVCFDGDGSFLMTLQELAVAVREDLDVTVFVLNNEAIGMVRQWQDAFYDGRHTASEYPWVPEFDAIAEAFGATGFRATTQSELADATTDALATDGPAIVDCHVDPTADVFPMVPDGAQAHEFALREEHL
jgi:acetolactate synthase-1/2/3 large subunit